MSIKQPQSKAVSAQQTSAPAQPPANHSAIPAIFVFIIIIAGLMLAGKCS